MSFLNNARKAMKSFGKEAGKHIGGATNTASKQIRVFGKDIGPKIAPALEEAWKQADAFGQEAAKQTSAAAKHTKQWVEQHPGETAGMFACVVAAPLGIGVAYSGLHMVGFTATGVAAGSAAAAVQFSIGNVAATSTFAVFQSAATGGASATLVSGVAAGTATGIAIAATAPRLIEAVRGGKKKVTIDDVTYKIGDKGRKNPRQKASKL
jgi:ElaB/YqjD/DUF883 family membrane-anchored ribosome-binding protein